MGGTRGIYNKEGSPTLSLTNLRPFPRMRIEIQHLPKSVAMSFLQNNIYKLVIGNEKFHPIIHRQMRFIVHFVATKTYLCFNAKHIYLLVRNGQYWPPGMQTGTKSTDFYFIFIITCVQVEIWAKRQQDKKTRSHT